MGNTNTANANAVSESARRYTVYLWDATTCKRTTHRVEATSPEDALQRASARVSRYHDAIVVDVNGDTVLMVGAGSWLL